MSDTINVDLTTSSISQVNEVLANARQLNLSEFLFHLNPTVGASASVSKRGLKYKVSRVAPPGSVSPADITMMVKAAQTALLLLGDAGERDAVKPRPKVKEELTEAPAEAKAEVETVTAPIEREKPKRKARAFKAEEDESVTEVETASEEQHQ